MKSKLLYLMLIVVALGFGCKKTTFDETSKGEALNAFQITAPADNLMLILNSATPSKTVVITWTAAVPGVNTAPKYTFVAALKTGNLDQPIIQIPSDNGGLSNQLTATQKQLDDALKAAGIAEGAKTDLIWTVVADNGSLKVKANTSQSVSITRFGDGVSNFLLYGPVTSTNAVTINPTLATQFLTFKWQKSFAGKTGSKVTYKVKFIQKHGDFSSPVFEFPSNDSGSDSTLTVSYKDFDAALNNAGFTDQAATDSLKWSVEAVSGAFSKFSDYTNDLSILRDVSLYMVGDASEAGWNEKAPTYMFRDANNRDVYSYTGQLNTGGFKFISVLGSWVPQYGVIGTNGIKAKTDGNDPDPAAIQVATKGYYSVKVNLKSMTYTFAAYNASSATTYTLIGVIGAFNNWGSDLKMVNSTLNPHIWTVTNKFDADTELKFRANGGWDVNWGTAASNVDGKYGVGQQDNAGNLKVKAGTYTILFNDITKEYIFYSK